jgi:hypothetical protein
VAEAVKVGGRGVRVAVGRGVSVRVLDGRGVSVADGGRGVLEGKEIAGMDNAQPQIVRTTMGKTTASVMRVFIMIFLDCINGNRPSIRIIFIYIYRLRICP